MQTAVTRSKVAAVAAAVACGAACLGMTSCSPYQYEVVPLTAEEATSHLKEGDHIRIQTISGDLIDDVFVRTSEGELQCVASTTDVSSIAAIERRTIDPATAVGSTLLVFLGGFAIVLGVGMLIWGFG